MMLPNGSGRCAAISPPSMHITPCFMLPMAKSVKLVQMLEKNGATSFPSNVNWGPDSPV